MFRQARHSALRGRAFALLATIAGTSICLGQTNVFTFHNDNSRTGQNLAETTLTPANVRSASFGKLFSVAMDGKVDAQPLYVSGLTIAGQTSRNVVFAATEHDTVYAFDADSGTIYWQVSLLKPGETTSDDRGCGQVTPEIGITATPVIDLTAGSHGTIYAVAMSKDGSGNYYQRIHALDITTDAEEFGGPTTVQASYPGTGANSSNGSVIFDPKQYKDRPGLMLLNGIVYTSWGSHCDINPYTGWIIGYDRATLQQRNVFNFAPNGSEAALWNSGGAPTADSQGNILVSVANGTFDTTLTANGFPSAGDYGNAFVRLAVNNGILSAADYWTMDNSNSESNSDTDLGSGGIMLLPDMKDSNGNTRRLGVGAGKDSNLYVVDRDNMGKYDSSSDATIYQQLTGALPGGIWSNPAYFNNSVYFGSVGSQLRAFGISAARLSNSPTSATANSFGYPGVTPSISASGTQNAILWAVENSNPAVLHAYDATDLATEFYNSNQANSGRDQFGPGNKYIVPTIANGKVFVGTANSVAVFGLLGQAAGPIPDGQYVLTNESSNLVLDDPGLSPNPGVQMIEWSNNGGANQKWYFTSNGAGFYTIRNGSSGLYLTDPSGGTNAGAKLLQEPADGGDSQLWSMNASGSGYFIHNKAGGTVIDDPGFSAKQGTKIQLWPLNGGSNQIWLIH
ncbi:MAG: RICIN domain-containing protein [Acidobacteriota bacterium]|nr:RICIN domain-containing protein [Acidobacteriota bacterium]